MRGGERDGAGLSALADRTPRRPFINRWHALMQTKSRVMIKPAYLDGHKELALRVAKSAAGEPRCPQPVAVIAEKSKYSATIPFPRIVPGAKLRKRLCR